MKGAGVGESPTIAEGLSLRHNSFNFLRLIGAYVVVAVHSPTLAGLGDEPRWGSMQFGLMPVAYFFVMSGFLITHSRHTLSGLRFSLRRVARIGPGFWVCMAVTGLVISRLASLEKGDWSWDAARGYALGHMLFLPGQDQLLDILDGNPISTTWNGSAWTIPLELLCYTGIGCALAVPMLRRKLRALSSLGLVALIALGVLASLFTSEAGALFLVTSFAVGIALYSWQDVIRLDGRLALASAVLSLVCFGFPETMFLGALPFGYLVLWFAARAPDRIKRIGATNDISYGIYLYAWPLQQLLVNFGVAERGLFVFVVASMVSASALGWVSWLLVERPATEWVRARTGRRSGRANSVGKDK